MQIPGWPFQNPLNYTGPKVNLVPIKVFYRIPTITDTKYRIGSMVLIGNNPVSGEEGALYYLSEFNSSGEALWVKLSTGGGASAESFLTDDGAPAVEPDSSSEIEILGGDGISVTGQGPGNTITITATTDDILTLTSDNGSPGVVPSSNNINILGGDGISVTGQGPGSTLTITASTDDILSITTDDGSPGVVPSSGNINILAGTGCTVTGQGPGSTVTINVTGGGLSWTHVTGTTQALVAHNAYLADNAAGVVFTLPVTSSLGDTFTIVNINAGGFSIAQNAGQVIQLGTSSTTTGVTGSLQTSNIGDTFAFVCTVANTEFRAFTGNIGNLSLT